MKVLYSVLFVSLALGATTGCGSSKAKGSSIGTVGSNQNSAAGSNGTAGSNGFLGNGMTVMDNSPITDAEVCITITADAEPVPVDLYIMLDQSASMGDMISGGRTRWAAVSEAISSFVADPRAAGIGVGIDYFGVGTSETANCMASNYSNPDVPIAALPGNQAALTMSISNALGPNSGSLTPTSAALDGALQYATQHAMSLQTSDPTRETFVVLATDGFPTQCDTSLPAIGALAHTAFTATPSIQTHVIGLQEGAPNAQAIADAGGGKAFVINDTDDVTQKFLDAMLSITASRIPSYYDIPRDGDGGAKVINAQRAEVSFVPVSTGQSVILEHRATQQDCGGSTLDGYFFDRQMDPTRVYLCDKTWNDLGAGQLKFRLTCVGGSGPIQ